MGRLVASGLFVLGAFLALFPFVSAARLSNEVVSMAPATEQLVSTDTSALAIFDDDFLLGTATYSDLSTTDVANLFIAAGFTDRFFNQESGSWIANPCCGQYDAALARFSETSDGDVLVEFSAVDSDVVFSWPFFAVPGVFIAAMTGVALVALSSRERDTVVAAQEPSPVG